MSLLFENKVITNRSAFSDKVKSVASRLGVHPDWLMFAMDFETGGSFSPSIENSFGCVGLIQFCPDKSGGSYKTIGGKQYQMSQIKSMSNVDQMELVYEYLKPYKGKMLTFYDIYLAILWPAALGKTDSYVIATGTNPVFDLNKNGQILLSEVKQFLDDRAMKLVPVTNQENFFKKKVQKLLALCSYNQSSGILCKFIKEKLLLAA